MLIVKFLHYIYKVAIKNYLSKYIFTINSFNAIINLIFQKLTIYHSKVFDYYTMISD